MNNLKVIVYKTEKDPTSNVMDFYLRQPSESINVSQLNKYIFHDHPFYENILEENNSSSKNKYTPKPDSSSRTNIPDFLNIEKTPNIMKILENPNLHAAEKPNNLNELDNTQLSTTMVAVDPKLAIPSNSQTTICQKQIPKRSIPIKHIKPIKRKKLTPAVINIKDTISSNSNKYMDYISKANKQMNMLKTSFRNISYEIESNITTSFQLLQQPVRNKHIILVHFISEQVNFTLPVLTAKFYSISQKETLFTTVTNILQSINVNETFVLKYRTPYRCKGQSHVVCVINFDLIETT